MYLTPKPKLKHKIDHSVEFKKKNRKKYALDNQKCCI